MKLLRKAPNDCALRVRPTAPGRPRVLGHVVYQKGKSSEPSVVSHALWLPEFDSYYPRLGAWGLLP